MKRTHLPLNGMRVFDAAARHLSFTRAADELAVTPAAVGQQIRALEDVLGVILFRRTPKGLELTPEAANGLEALRTGFLQFEEAVRAMQTQQSSKSLTIAAPRDVTAKWLAAKLAAYRASDPELRFVLVSAEGSLDFTEANLDLAIRYGSDSGDLESHKLTEGTMVRVAAVNGGADAPIGWPGCPEEEAAVIHVADAGLAIDAAASGLGMATVPLMLAEADLAAGRVKPIGDPRAVEETYWLVAPLPQWRQKKVKALVAALAG